MSDLLLPRQHSSSLSFIYIPLHIMVFGRNKAKAPPPRSDVIVIHDSDSEPEGRGGKLSSKRQKVASGSSISDIQRILHVKNVFFQARRPQRQAPKYTSTARRTLISKAANVSMQISRIRSNSSRLEDSWFTAGGYRASRLSWLWLDTNLALRVPPRRRRRFNGSRD